MALSLLWQTQAPHILQTPEMTAHKNKVSDKAKSNVKIFMLPECD